MPGYRNYQSRSPGAGRVACRISELGHRHSGRSLSTNINGTNRNSNVTRTTKSQRQPWLLHHAGYVMPAEMVETVNVTTGAGDPDQGIPARFHHGADQVGTNQPAARLSTTTSSA